MESNLTEFETESESRPTLLTVLCILTLIGSSWGILTNLWAYTTAAQTSKMVSYTRSRMAHDTLSRKDSALYKVGERKREVFGEKVIYSFTKMFTEDTIRKNALGGIVSAAFTLFGAILMWRLQRRGFYLYIVGVLIGITIPFYLYGSNLLAVGISVFTGFFGLVFIALYALTLKSLKN